MNSVSFIFHTVKMTWPSFPQKSKYLQSVFNSIAGHKFSINIFWIENRDFIPVVLWKNRGFFGSDGVLSAEKVSVLSQGLRFSYLLPLQLWTAGLGLSCPTHRGHGPAAPPSGTGATGRLVGAAAWLLSPALGAEHWTGPATASPRLPRCLSVSLCVFSVCVCAKPLGNEVSMGCV